MAGRRRKPTAIKKLTGEKRPSRLNPDEPMPERCIPDCPAWLDDIARARWNFEAEILDEIGVLTVADQGTLEMRCVVYSDLCKLQDILKREGRVIDIYVKDANEKVYLAGQKAHPAAIQFANLLKEFRAYGSLLGLDPSSRSKLSVKKRSEINPFDRFGKGNEGKK